MRNNPTGIIEGDANMKREHVLICDDEEGIRESLNLILSEQYTIGFASNVKEALDYLKDNPQTNLILLDIKMPRVDGLEALRQIKKTQPAIEVLIVTGYRSIETATEAIKNGAAGYIVKPFDKAQILKAVQETLEKKRST